MPLFAAERSLLLVLLHHMRRLKLAILQVLQKLFYILNAAFLVVGALELHFGRRNQCNLPRLTALQRTALMLVEPKACTSPTILLFAGSNAFYRLNNKIGAYIAYIILCLLFLGVPQIVLLDVRNLLMIHLYNHS